MSTTVCTGHAGPAGASRPLLRGWLHAAMVPPALVSAWALWQTTPPVGASRLPV
jgi:hypothetical protein